MDYQSDAVTRIREAVAALRAQADSLESVLVALRPEFQLEDQVLPVFDPRTDEPPIRPDVRGTREQRDWCALMLWGQLIALNVIENRGATSEESIRIAVRSGYRDGRAWARWDGWRKGDDGERWAEPSAWGTLRYYYGEVRRAIPPYILDGGPRS